MSASASGLKRRRFVARVCCVQRSSGEIVLEAESRGDAYVLARRMAAAGLASLSANGEEIDVESVHEMAREGAQGAAR